MNWLFGSHRQNPEAAFGVWEINKLLNYVGYSKNQMKHSPCAEANHIAGFKKRDVKNVAKPHKGCYANSHDKTSK